MQRVFFIVFFAANSKLRAARLQAARARAQEAGGQLLDTGGAPAAHARPDPHRAARHAGKGGRAHAHALEAAVAPPLRADGENQLADALDDMRERCQKYLLDGGVRCAHLGLTSPRLLDLDEDHFVVGELHVSEGI